MERIFTKSRKQYGRVYPAVATEFLAEVVKGKSIKIACDAGYRTGRSKEFKLGDYAEYDSYNLSYYGPIIAIADKTVTIICRHDVERYKAGAKVKTYRLDLNAFAWRNIDFDVNEASAANSETMMYI
jgi:hypothetical protein